MVRFGQVTIWLGVLIIAVGAGQLAYAILTSPDPNPNPVGNGMLWWLASLIGMILICSGLVMTGRMRRWF